MLGPEPTVIIRGGDSRAESHLRGIAGRERLRVVFLEAEERTEASETVAVDDQGRASDLLGIRQPGSGYLVRPDVHVAARWHRFDPTLFEAAYARLLARVH